MLRAVEHDPPEPDGQRKLRNARGVGGADAVIEHDAAEVAARTKFRVDQLVLHRKHWTRKPADAEPEAETNYRSGTLGNNHLLVTAREAFIRGLYEKGHATETIAAFVRCEHRAVKSVLAELKSRDRERRYDVKKNAARREKKRAEAVRVE